MALAGWGVLEGAEITWRASLKGCTCAARAGGAAQEERLSMLGVNCGAAAAHHSVPWAVGPALTLLCPLPRFLQPHDTGHVHTDVFLPGLLDLWPDSVCRGLHPLPADRGSLGEALWHLPVLPDQGLGECCQASPGTLPSSLPAGLVARSDSVPGAGWKL